MGVVVLAPDGRQLVPIVRIGKPGDAGEGPIGTWPAWLMVRAPSNRVLRNGKNPQCGASQVLRSYLPYCVERPTVWLHYIAERFVRGFWLLV